jgi:hypothetical protein
MSSSVDTNFAAQRCNVSFLRSLLQVDSVQKVADSARESASDAMFRAQNAHNIHVICCDLHGQHFEPALKYLTAALDDCFNSKMPGAPRPCHALQHCRPDSLVSSSGAISNVCAVRIVRRGRAGDGMNFGLSRTSAD